MRPSRAVVLVAVATAFSLLGDQTLFWRQDGVESCWSFLTPILEGCEMCGDRAEALHFYEAGSLGPAAAENMKNGMNSIQA